MKLAKMDMCVPNHVETDGLYFFVKDVLKEYLKHVTYVNHATDGCSS